jgi:hypothetical protein
LFTGDRYRGQMKLLLILTLLVTASAAAQNQSVYTSTRGSACKTIASFPDEGGSYIGECRGVGGYKVELLEGDLRQTLNIITPDRKKFELDLWGFYGGFSYVGQKLEWRTKSGVPVALIARFNVADGVNSQKTISYLTVSKIGKTGACVTDIVMPGATQNAEARTLADAAGDKPCKKTN